MISAPDLRESVDDADEGADDKVVAYWNRMMQRYGSADDYEEAIKAQYHAGELDLVIVCSKWLTGFDEPLCQVLYLDKELKEHGLLQAIARTNRLCEGKSYGMIVDYRGLIKKLDEAIELYSGAGLENFDGHDLKGVVVDVLSAIGTVRSDYSALMELLSAVPGLTLAGTDAEAVEVFLADSSKREEFYKRLCNFGRSLNLVLNSEKTYEALAVEEREKYIKAFGFFSAVRRSVKPRYGDSIDNREYEPLMQNLLDVHLSVEGLKRITEPVDILDRDAFEKELNELGSLRAKADAIRTRLAKSINTKYQENPAYYENFSKRIKEALELYKARTITEAEYLAKMRDILEDYRTGKSAIAYPDRIRANVHAQAFYGVLTAIFSNEKLSVEPDFAAEMALDITTIIEKHSQVDWTHNLTIHDRISQDIDDLFYRYQKEKGLVLSFDVIDMIIENVKTVALRRFA